MKSFKDRLRDLSPEQLKEKIKEQKFQIVIMQRDLETMKDVLLEEYDERA